MATLQALFDLRNSSSLRNRVAAACWEAAKAIFIEADATPLHAERLAWAVRAFQDNGEGSAIKQVFRAAAVLLQDSGESSTDSAIQTAVDAAVDKFAAVEGT